MDSNRIKTSQASFLNSEELSMGLAGIELSEKVLAEMNDIIANDYKNIENDLTAQLSRLDTYLKTKIGALPRNESFIQCFFDKKRINQFGKKLPKITDEELIKFTQQYILELNKLTDRTNDQTKIFHDYVAEKNTYRWLINESKIYDLKRTLTGIYIEKLEFQDFKIIFTNKQVAKVKVPIRWLTSNATELLYFIMQLMEKNVIEKQERIDYDLLKVCFLTKDGKKFDAKFNVLKTNIKTRLSKKKQENIERIILNLIN